MPGSRLNRPTGATTDLCVADDSGSSGEPTGTSAALRGSRLSVSIPATEITDVVRVRFDAQRISPILIRTKRHGTVRLVPRLNGFVDFIVELRQANPAVRISSL